MGEKVILNKEEETLYLRLRQGATRGTWRYWIPGWPGVRAWGGQGSPVTPASRA